MSRRAFVVVLDACGVGALPDAADYGDAGSDTLGHLAEIEGGLDLPMLGALGLGNVTPILGVPPVTDPAVHGRLGAIGPGKDSIVGHWGLMGLAAPATLPTWPNGIDDDERRRMGEIVGTTLLAGATSDGLHALDRWGPEHLASGHPILYTSAVDSVLQVAAHLDRWSVEDLHDLCSRLHRGLPADRRPARVIARPFAGEPGRFVRTGGRRDFALAPPGPSYLDAVRAAGVPVHGVGKVVDIFAGRGFDAVHPGATNAEALRSIEALLDVADAGFVFVNLVETDERFGHRKDTAGFHRALREIDAAVARWLPRLGPDDLLVLTADHGVDPAASHRFHTREHAPLLARFAVPDDPMAAAGEPGRGDRAAGTPIAGAAPGEPEADPPVWASGRFDGTLADVGASVLRWLAGTEPAHLPGRSFVP